MSGKLIISGGGTGGHIFPAISIANEIKRLRPDIEILFVGADGGMEMTLVPKNNYKIEGVPITGIMRSLTFKNILKNLGFPFRLLKSLSKSRGIVKRFKPDVVVGVGGYASGPLGRAASSMGVPLIVCEQNAYPGITNKWLAPRAARILLGNEAAAKYFDAAKSKVTGNPVRDTLKHGDRAAGLKAFGLDPNKKIVLSLGGSLGAKTLNDALEKDLEKFIENDVQLIWQCGKRYYPQLKDRVKKHPLIKLMPFIEDMPSAYAVADLIITRAGGSTISELILLSKPSVMVPSPNVAEDHQTKNALSLVERDAALMVKDVEASEKLVPETLALLGDESRLAALQQGIENVEKHDAANEIAMEILALMPK